MALAKGQSIELTVTSLAYGGKGVARADNLVVFVDGAIPGDTGLAEVTKVKRRYVEARLHQVTQPSPDRCAPRCAHFGTCGGCSLQHMDYAAQLRWKRQQVVDSLQRLGGLAEPPVGATLGMDDPWHYRNRADFAIGAIEGIPAVGFRPRGRWDSVLSIRECHLLPPEFCAIRETVESWLHRHRVSCWDPRTRQGYARHLLVRCSASANGEVSRDNREPGEILVSIITGDGPLPASAEFVHELRQTQPRLVGVVHAVNRGTAELTTGLERHTLWGRDHLSERLGGAVVKVSVDAFFQTNSPMTHTLYALAVREAGLTGSETVWDVYCGVGSIGLSMAERARAVIGIESVASAVADARENARSNGFTNMTFIEGQARRVLRGFLQEGSHPDDKTGHDIHRRPDVVVVDPPRSGLSPKVVLRIAALEPTRIVYVSCNPTTLAPDLAGFLSRGFRLERVTPVDMFPHTPHIEAVAKLVQDGED